MHLQSFIVASHATKGVAELNDRRPITGDELLEQVDSTVPS
jgi:hypothetical protein